jgi:hypothetical protein
MDQGYPNPSNILPLSFKINRQARIIFTLTVDGASPNTTGWTWQLFIKRFAGDRLNVINLTLGNGLRYEVYSDTDLIADFSSAQTNIEEGEYYWELVRTDIERTWIEGKADFEFSKSTTETGTESSYTVNVDSSGTPVSIALTSERTINITAGAGADTTAIHDNESGEINAITSKTTPVSADVALIEDSAASYAKKKVLLSALPISTATQTALDAKQALVNAAVALTDAASITLTAIKHTLTTDEATITFADAYTGDFLSNEITFNATGATWTFPTGSKLTYINEAGTATTSTTTMTISGATSGDKMVMSRGLFGSQYYYIVKNFG